MMAIAIFIELAMPRIRLEFGPCVVRAEGLLVPQPHQDPSIGSFRGIWGILQNAPGDVLILGSYLEPEFPEMRI